VVKTRKVDVVLNNKLIKKDFEIPEFWSDRAAIIVGSKYAMDYENSALDIIDRVVNQITQWGQEQEYFTSGGEQEGNAECFNNDLRNILINQRASFNSPVWFNCGVPENENQMSACFILPVEDTMEDILAHTTREGLIFRGGSGAGVNVSRLRAKGEKLSNKGEASGPLSFMKVWDTNAGSIKSGGKNRRSAKMVCMDVDHPDIIEFIKCKQEEEEKAKILTNNGIDYEEAYTTVAFQNTNHSIRVTDAFMRSAEEDMTWDLTNRGNKEVANVVNAKDILKRTAEIAWTTGDPGIQFNDAMNKDNPVPVSGRINSTNPCSEFSAIDNSSCNLASLNLVKYINPKVEGNFDAKQFASDIKTLITAMDILIDAADYPTPEVEEVTKKTRPLGLGFTNLGAYLILKGLSYDSEEAREEAAIITEFMTTVAYRQSIELAKKLGSFGSFKENEKTCLGIAMKLTKTDETDDIWQDIKEYGLRNSQLTLLAPCGTTSFMMDCDTTGIEPLYALKATKTLAGGGTIEMVPKCVTEAKEIYTTSDEPSQLFKTANEIHWKDHVLMMAACQQHLNGAISKTINFPSDCTPEDIYDAYMFAWKNGIKALAIYRNGSKEMQPLKEIREKEQKEVKEDRSEWTPVRKKLPDTCYGPRHKFNIAGFKGYIKVSTYDEGNPGEIFVTASKSGSTMQGILDAFATAISIGLQYGVPLDKFIEKFTGTTFSPAGITLNEDIRSTSSIIDYIFRWMQLEFGEFVDEETEITNDMAELPPMKEVILDGPTCITCGGLTQRSGTCYVCSACGSSTGCS
jgi:ribonucleoside-diphosphate reductase alpha chain